MSIPPGATGIGPGSGDPELDPISGYLLATVNYEVIGTPGSVSELFLNSHSPIVCDCTEPLPDPSILGADEGFLDARITIVPEAAGMALIGIALIGLQGMNPRRYSIERLGRRLP